MPSDTGLAGLVNENLVVVVLRWPRYTALPAAFGTEPAPLPTIPPPRLLIYARVGSGNVDAPAHVRSGG